MATTGPGTTDLVPGPQLHQLQGQRLLFFFLIPVVLIATPATFIVHRPHLTFDPIAVQDQQLIGQQQCNTKIYFYALKPVLQSAIMDLFSSISGFFVGRRHQLVQSLPSFFAIALISTSTASALLVHRYPPAFDLIAVQDQQLTGQQQCTTQNYFYALKPVMQPAFMDLLSSISEFFIGQRHQFVQSKPSTIAIVLISTSTASSLLAHRNHPTFDLIAVHNKQLTEQQQCTTQIYFYALKSVMQRAITDLFSSLSGFFIGQRHQLVQALPSFFVFVLISTSSRLAFIPPPFA